MTEAHGTYQRTDLIILGGGAAGLSLGREIALNSDLSGLRVVILEKRESYHNDRSWCFFAPKNHKFRSLCSASWLNFAFSKDGEIIEKSCERTPYHFIPSINFYSDSRNIIDQSSNVQLRTGVTLDKVQDEDEEVIVLTDIGEFRARYAVDTRPPPKKAIKEPFMLQIFHGSHVTAQRPVFDEKRVWLMRDLQADSRGLAFLYILPFTPKKALVEWTRFSLEQISKDEICKEAKVALKGYMRDAEFECEEEEHGVLPMGRIDSTALAASKNIFPAGTRGGALRPSTGYAFQRIIRWAEDCTQNLQKTGRPIGHQPDPSFQIWMDKIYLSVMTKSPETGPEIKMNMARKLNSGQFIRFLSDKAGFWDNMAVIRSQPIWPFFKEAFLDILRKTGLG